jgi:hypothetical protein
MKLTATALTDNFVPFQFLNSTHEMRCQFKQLAFPLSVEHIETIAGVAMVTGHTWHTCRAQVSSAVTPVQQVSLILHATHPVPTVAARSVQLVA